MNGNEKISNGPVNGQMKHDANKERGQVIMSDVLSRDEFVNQHLNLAKMQAVEADLRVGDKLEYRVKDLPIGAVSLGAVTFGMCNKAYSYGFNVELIIDDHVHMIVLANFSK